MKVYCGLVEEKNIVQFFQFCEIKTATAETTVENRKLQNHIQLPNMRNKFSPEMFVCWNFLSNGEVLLKAPISDFITWN